ncbi:hypothetical protein RJT34_02704 [Clitoria ternatea]|uniref:Uncharacterized protein n=1 Tax=Clitoria ternatea TaxID=43366 RepID=A0AAN9KKT9_CLITE
MSCIVESEKLAQEHERKPYHCRIETKLKALKRKNIHINFWKHLDGVSHSHKYRDSHSILNGHGHKLAQFPQITSRLASARETNQLCAKMQSMAHYSLVS